jgi:hypothetical protein
VGDTTSTGLMIIPSNPPPQRGDNHLLGTDITSPFKFEIEFKDVILVALRLGFHPARAHRAGAKNRPLDRAP